MDTACTPLELTETTSAQTRRNWHRRKRERPAEIRAAALEILAEKGFAATRMIDIAERAGVTKGTLYLYFRNKQELLNSLTRPQTAASVEAERG
jgi:AcrR family transcriptional regulator